LGYFDEIALKSNAETLFFFALWNIFRLRVFSSTRCWCFRNTKRDTGVGFPGEIRWPRRRGKKSNDSNRNSVAWIPPKAAVLKGVEIFKNRKKKIFFEKKEKNQQQATCMHSLVFPSFLFLFLDF
jgi:hypothetical protein